jgi:non-homologous end joining protein Ku
MVAIARVIIRQRTGTFDPSAHRDRYQEALRGLIEAKLKGVTRSDARSHHAAHGNRSDGGAETQSRTGNACNGCHDA